jgi:hypothetical protein
MVSISVEGSRPQIVFRPLVTHNAIMIQQFMDRIQIIKADPHISINDPKQPKQQRQQLISNSTIHSLLLMVPVVYYCVSFRFHEREQVLAGPRFGDQV